MLSPYISFLTTTGCWRNIDTLYYVDNTDRYGNFTIVKFKYWWQYVLIFVNSPPKNSNEHTQFLTQSGQFITASFSLIPFCVWGTPNTQDVSEQKYTPLFRFYVVPFTHSLTNFKNYNFTNKIMTVFLYPVVWSCPVNYLVMMTSHPSFSMDLHSIMLIDSVSYHWSLSCVHLTALLTNHSSESI